MGRRFGNNAVEMLKNGDTGFMVALQKSRLRKVPLEKINESPSLVNVEEHYDTEKLNVKIEWTDRD
jgi:6-phosphofructokinase